MPAALDSVFLQTYKNWEVIIVNDGSPDNTEEVALRYCAKDPRFKYLKKENGGLSSARNAGLAAATGDLIQFLDSDDYIHPQKLQHSIDLMAQSPPADIVVTNFKMFVETPADATEAFCDLKQEYLTFEHVLFGWDAVFNIPIHCGLFKADLFQAQPFAEHLKTGEDWLMWLSLFKNKPHAAYSGQPLAYYRNNPMSMTKDPVFLRNSLMETYKYLLQLLPAPYMHQFTCVILDRLNDTITSYEKEVWRLKNKRYYKAGKWTKDFLRRLKPGRK